MNNAAYHPIQAGLRDRRGFALPGTIMLFVSVTIMGLAYMAFCARESRLSYKHLNQTRAYFIAQAGVERAYSELDDDWSSAGDFSSAFAEGRFQVTFTTHTSNEATVESTGVVWGADGSTVLASRTVSVTMRR